jgi:hypothetical protein
MSISKALTAPPKYPKDAQAVKGRGAVSNLMGESECLASQDVVRSY